MLSALFPQHLGRMAFLVRVIPLEILAGFCITDMMGSSKWDSKQLTTLAVLAGLVIYGVFFVFLPRVRDCSMPAWTLVFAVVPGISALYGLVLMYGGSRVLRFGGVEKSFPVEALQRVVPGNKCLSCGKVMVLATDGVANPYGGVLCNECHGAQEVA